MPNREPENLTVAGTGASGAIFLKHLLLALERDARVKVVNFIVSDSGMRVLAEELGVRGRSNVVAQLLGKFPAKFTSRATLTSAPTSPAARIRRMG